jgi:hypothetical protein
MIADTILLMASDGAAETGFAEGNKWHWVSEKWVVLFIKFSPRRVRFLAWPGLNRGFTEMIVASGRCNFQSALSGAS